jgi:hypothetical protein
MKIRLSLSLVAFAATLLGTASLAAQGTQLVKVPSAKQSVSYGSSEITIRVYDFAHVDPKAFLSAEGKATRILADAGLDAHWVDCAISPADLDNNPSCHSASQTNVYVLRIETNAMAALHEKSQNASGVTNDCGTGSCTASIFYDRIRDLASGYTAPTNVLVGRVMARQVGHLILGANSHSQAGIMQDSLSFRQLSTLASNQLLFTPEESRMMKTQRPVLEQASGAQVKPAEIGNESETSHANLDTADSRR